MAMTKRFKVSFEVTAKLSSDVLEILEEDALLLCKQVDSGEIVPDGKQRELLTQFLTRGMDGVMSYIVRTTFRRAIKELPEEYNDRDSLRLSPATVREVR